MNIDEKYIKSLSEIGGKQEKVRTIIVITILCIIFCIIALSCTRPPNAYNDHSRTGAPQSASNFSLTSNTEAILSPKAAEELTPKITIHQEDVIISLKDEEIEEIDQQELEPVIFYSNNPLTASMGRNKNGPSGEETWYNRDMSYVVFLMRDLGFSEEEYPYWIRGDGVKMLGNYVMVAAELNIRPKGTIIETSLGLGIVCDTGLFAETNKTQIDIATNW